MKKLLPLLLAIVIALSFTSCGSKTPSDTSGSEKTESRTKAEFSRGEISGNAYHSNFAAITFTADENWTFSTDEQIAEAMNVGSQYINGNYDINKIIEETGNVTDMMAVNSGKGANIIVQYENLKKTGSVNMSSKDYAEAVIKQINNMSTIEYNFSEITTEKISGNEYCRLVASATVSGASICQEYLLRTFDGYAISIIITVTKEEDLADIEAMIS